MLVDPRHPGPSASQRRNARRGEARAKRRRCEADARPYYTAERPATARTFRESMNILRRMEVQCQEITEQLDGLVHLYRCPSALKRPELSLLERRAVRHRQRHLVRAWRAETRAGRVDRRLLGRCFAAWAWHPDGALVRGLAARHAGSFAPAPTPEPQSKRST